MHERFIRIMSKSTDTQNFQSVINSYNQSLKNLEKSKGGS